MELRKKSRRILDRPHKLSGFKNTVSKRLIGGKSIAEAREDDQLLSIPEERALVKWITRLTMNGHPAIHIFIKEMADEIRQQRDNEINREMELISYNSISTFWVFNLYKTIFRVRDNIT